MKTTYEVLSEIRAELNEPFSIDESEREWSDTLLLIWMNDAYRTIRKLVLQHAPSHLIESVDVDFTEDGDSLYEFEQDVLSIINGSVKDITNTRVLVPLEYHEFPTNETGYPLYYTMLGRRTFQIDTTPGMDLTIRMKLMYSATHLDYDPDTSTDTDIELLEELLPFLKDYVTMRAYNQTEARVDFETSFYSVYRAEIVSILEERLQIEPVGQGPWTT